MPRRTSTDWILLLILALIWGTSFLFTKVAVHATAPATIVLARVFTGAVTLTLLLFAAGLRFPPPGKIWVQFVALGIMGNALPFFLITWGQHGIDSGLAGILMAIMPLATLLLAHYFVDGERMTTRTAVGFIGGFAGIVVLVGPSALRELGGTRSDIERQAAVLAGALCYAINVVLARRLPPTHVLVVSAATLSAATFVMLATLTMQGHGLAAMLPTSRSLPSVLWLGFMSTAAATLIYFRIIASAGATFLSLINYLIPVIAVVAGTMLLGEQLDASALLALALILGGVALSQQD
jgi:drug/metabolite transporter (DMT)-like permease